MRDIFLKENECRKRGCLFCADGKKTNKYNAVLIECPYDTCPYHELDDFDSYEDYLDSQRWTFPAERRKDGY
jgi:hypothetical protein